VLIQSGEPHPGRSGPWTRKRVELQLARLISHNISYHNHKHPPFNFKQLATMFGQENTGQLELSEFGVCSYYLRGTCRRGGECQLLHPPELSIKLQPKEDFTVSTATGQACQRCLERMVPVRAYLGIIIAE
jgi:hypothetical protein